MYVIVGGAKYFQSAHNLVLSGTWDFKYGYDGERATIKCMQIAFRTQENACTEIQHDFMLNVITSTIIIDNNVDFHVDGWWENYTTVTNMCACTCACACVCVPAIVCEIISQTAENKAKQHFIMRHEIEWTHTDVHTLPLQFHMQIKLQCIFKSVLHVVDVLLSTFDGVLISCVIWNTLNSFEFRQLNFASCSHNGFDGWARIGQLLLLSSERDASWLRGTNASWFTHFQQKLDMLESWLLF